jgi:hypothetical protein
LVSEKKASSVTLWQRLSSPWAIGAFAFLLLFAGHWLYEAAVPVDDAYITFRYAENLVRHGELAFNPGERVEGYTSFAWILLTAPAAAFGKACTPSWALFLCLLAWSTVVGLTWRHLKRAGDVAPSGVLSWFAVLYLALCSPAIIWTWSAMETVVFALAWIAAWAAHLHEQEHNRWPWRSALLTTAAGLLHPEGVLVGVVLGLSWFRPWRGDRARRGAFYWALAYGLFGAYWLWRWHYFGYFMPNTYYAKVGGGGALFRSGFTYVMRSAVSAVLPLVLVGLAAWRVRHWRNWPRWLWLALGLVGILTLYTISVGGDYFPFQRFLLPSYPFTVLAVWWLWKNPSRASRSPAVAGLVQRYPWLAAAVAVLALNTWSNVIPPGHMLQHKVLQRAMYDYIDAGRALRDTVPPSATVATIPIGALGYYSECRILDLMGLTDKHLAHLDIPTGQRVVGHEKYDYGYIFTRQPEIILQLPALFTLDAAGLEMWLRKTTLNPQQYTMYDQPQLREQYRLSWHPVKKSKLRRRERPAATGVYAYVRHDRLGQPGYEKWQTLPGVMADYPFEDYQRSIAENQARLGRFRLGMWRFAPPPTNGGATPAPPDEPKQVWPPADAGPAPNATP